jgi:hypothetical protein
MQCVYLTHAKHGGMAGLKHFLTAIAVVLMDCSELI